MNLCNIFSISSLKIKASTFSTESQELLLEIASSVLVNKSVRDQAESPLLIQMVRYKQLNRWEISNNSSFSLYAASQMATNKQYVLSQTQTTYLAQMQQSIFIGENQKLLKSYVIEHLGLLKQTNEC